MWSVVKDFDRIGLENTILKVNWYHFASKDSKVWLMLKERLYAGRLQQVAGYAVGQVARQFFHEIFSLNLQDKFGVFR